MSDYFTSSSDAVLRSNVEKYRHFLAHLALPREYETEIIGVLGSYLGGHVDRAFGHDPIQLVAGDRLQLSDEGANQSMIASEPVPTSQPNDLSGVFEHASGPGRRKR